MEMLPFGFVLALAFDLLGVQLACIAANGVVLSIRNHEDWRTVTVLACVLLASAFVAFVGLHDMLLTYNARITVLGIIIAAIGVAMAQPVIQDVNETHQERR